MAIFIIKQESYQIKTLLNPTIYNSEAAACCVKNTNMQPEFSFLQHQRLKNI
jgi:hypothetical protein